MPKREVDLRTREEWATADYSHWRLKGGRIPKAEKERLIRLSKQGSAAQAEGEQTTWPNSRHTEAKWDEDERPEREGSQDQTGAALGFLSESGSTTTIAYVGSEVPHSAAAIYDERYPEERLEAPIQSNHRAAEEVIPREATKHIEIMPFTKNRRSSEGQPGDLQLDDEDWIQPLSLDSLSFLEARRNDGGIVISTRGTEA